MHDSVPFIGHYVSREGVEVDPMKTAAVQNWPTPHTVKDRGPSRDWHHITSATSLTLPLWLHP